MFCKNRQERKDTVYTTYQPQVDEFRSQQPDARILNLESFLSSYRLYFITLNDVPKKKEEFRATRTAAMLFTRWLQYYSIRYSFRFYSCHVDARSLLNMLYLGSGGLCAGSFPLVRCCGFNKPCLVTSNRPTSKRKKEKGTNVKEKGKKGKTIRQAHRPETATINQQLQELYCTEYGGILLETKPGIFYVLYTPYGVLPYTICKVRDWLQIPAATAMLKGNPPA